MRGREASRWRIFFSKVYDDEVISRLRWSDSAPLRILDIADLYRSLIYAVNPMTLYIVATPIGNLEDISARALRILGEVDLCFAEDTRHTLRLFRHFGIETRLVAYHDHSNDEEIERLVQRLVDGESAALVSDAGTPCISDPGYKLVRHARALGVRIEVIPGASALTAFLSGAGLPTDRFTFIGFLPTKVKARLEALSACIDRGGTTVAYESPRRLENTLRAIEELAPDAEVVVARELTKIHETWVHGTAHDVRRSLDESEGWRGEIVLGIYPAAAEELTDVELDAWIDALFAAQLSPSSVARTLAARLDLPRKRVYQRALERAAVSDE